MRVTLFVDFYPTRKETHPSHHFFETFELKSDQKTINDAIKQLFFAFSKNIDLRKSDETGKDQAFFIAREMLTHFLGILANTGFPDRYKFQPRQVIFD